MSDSVVSPSSPKVEGEKIPDLTSNLKVRMGLVTKGVSSQVSKTFYLAFFIGSTVVSLLLGLFSSKWSEWVQVFTAVIHAFGFTIMLASILVLVFGLTFYYLRLPRPVYLLDFTTYKAPEANKADHEMFMERSRTLGVFSEDSLEFQEKVLERSAIGKTAFPDGIKMNPPQLTMKMAKLEAEEVMFTIVEEILNRTNLKPRDIDILIVNCSLFCPTPSLSAMIINKFKMRSNILSYNLGGMGCSAGVISVDLAKHLLQAMPKKRALVISTENITQNWYQGNKKSMLITNTLFRVGGAALILSNFSSDKKRSMFKLLHTVRTHKGADDECFGCVKQEEDDVGLIGVTLSRSVMKVAGDALKTNITTLGPLVLPWSEQIKFLLNFIARTLLLKKLPKAVPSFISQPLYLLSDTLLAVYPESDNSLSASVSRTLRSICGLPLKSEESEATDDSAKASVGKPYLPDFTKAFQHFCVHAGGRGVIDAIEKNLKLAPHYLDASRDVLYNFGNTSSSSIWYEMEYHVNKSNVKAGDRCWQIAFGSGFKCNSAVWESLRDMTVDAA